MPKSQIDLESIVALPDDTRPTWLDRLPPDQREMAQKVKDYIAEHGGPKLTRARKLKEVYGLTVSAQTIAAWFRS